MSELGKRIDETRGDETVDAVWRRCKRCGRNKPPEEFPTSRRPSGRVKFDCYCRPCRKAYQHEWYLEHRDEALAAATARRQRQRMNRPPKPPPPERRPLREAVGFRTFENTRIQGNAGLGIAIAYFSRVGVPVAIPLTDTQRYDLIIEHEERLQRVQVKTTTMQARSGVYLAQLQTIGCNTKRTVTRKFHPDDYEWLFVVCGDACVYMIPAERITARTVLYLSQKYEPFRLED